MSIRQVLGEARGDQEAQDQAPPHLDPLPEGEGEGRASLPEGEAERGVPPSQGEGEGGVPRSQGEGAGRRGSGGDGIRLGESDRLILGAEARTVAAAFQDVERRGALQQLAAEADEGLIPAALTGELERLLEMGLQTGRFRGRYGPGGETAMARLFGKTPRGAEIARRVADANGALAGLSGQTLEQLSFSPSGWGGYTLQVKTDRYTVRVSIDALGIQAENLEVGA